MIARRFPVISGYPLRFCASSLTGDKIQAAALAYLFEAGRRRPTMPGSEPPRPLQSGLAGALPERRFFQGVVYLAG
jgi:hypothetical protein